MIGSNPVVALPEYGKSAELKIQPTSFQTTGHVPSEDLKASEWNWLWNQITAQERNTSFAMLSIFEELINFFTANNITPDAASTTQFKNLIEQLMTQIATTSVVGAVLASAAGGSVSADGTVNGLGNVASLSTTDKSSTVAGVQEISTGITSEKNTFATEADDIGTQLSDDVSDVLADAAPTNHASANTTYGAASTENYGHVKVTQGNGLTIASGVLAQDRVSDTTAGTISTASFYQNYILSLFLSGFNYIIGSSTSGKITGISSIASCTGRIFILPGTYTTPIICNTGATLITALPGTVTFNITSATRYGINTNGAAVTIENLILNVSYDVTVPVTITTASWYNTVKGIIVPENVAVVIRHCDITVSAKFYNLGATKTGDVAYIARSLVAQSYGIYVDRTTYYANLTVQNCNISVASGTQLGVPLHSGKDFNTDSYYARATGIMFRPLTGTISSSATLDAVHIVHNNITVQSYVSGSMSIGGSGTSTPIASSDSATTGIYINGHINLFTDINDNNINASYERSDPYDTPSTTNGFSDTANVYGIYAVPDSYQNKNGYYRYCIHNNYLKISGQAASKDGYFTISSRIIDVRGIFFNVSASAYFIDIENNIVSCASNTKVLEALSTDALRYIKTSSIYGIRIYANTVESINNAIKCNNNTVNLGFGYHFTASTYQASLTFIGIEMPHAIPPGKSVMYGSKGTEQITDNTVTPYLYTINTSITVWASSIYSYLYCYSMSRNHGGTSAAGSSSRIWSNIYAKESYNSPTDLSYVAFPPDIYIADAADGGWNDCIIGTEESDD